MKAPKKATAFLLSALLILAGASMVAAQGVTVTQVDGLNAEGKISDNATLTFHMTLNNTYADPIGAVDNGFWFFSDGATWAGLDGAWNPAYCWSPFVVPACPAPYVFDMGHFTKITGDTIGFGGINFMSGTGLVSGFNDVAYTIEIGPIAANSATFLTMDSCKYDVNEWCWSISMVGEVLCNWGGPYTYEFGEGQVVTTSLSQNPILLKDLESRVLEVYIHNEDIAAVDLCSGWC